MRTRHFLVKKKIVKKSLKKCYFPYRLYVFSVQTVRYSGWGEVLRNHYERLGISLIGRFNHNPHILLVLWKNFFQKMCGQSDQSGALDDPAFHNDYEGPPLSHCRILKKNFRKFLKKWWKRNTFFLNFPKEIHRIANCKSGAPSKSHKRGPLYSIGFLKNGPFS